MSAATERTGLLAHYQRLLTESAHNLYACRLRHIDDNRPQSEREWWKQQAKGCERIAAICEDKIEELRAEVPA